MRFNLLKDLNPEQREAAVCQTHCLTVAAPGSGKTKMLSTKAAFLLSGGSTVVAVTFTRDAAMELGERIMHQAGKETLPRLLVGTFHSINLLMAFPSRAKSQMGSAILAKARSNIKTPWKIANGGVLRNAIARAIDMAQIGAVELDDAMRVIERVKADPGSAKEAKERDLVHAYTEIMNRHKVIDFQDILLKTNEGLASGAISPLATDYLLLDEFQDTDLPQYEWAMMHAKAGSIITAVGDDDQSIYGFRRALGFKGMRMFADERRAAKVILGMNYRSHAEVLNCAGRLIAINEERENKSLVSSKGYGGSALWERFANNNLEADACVETALSAVKNGMTFGVLARTNKKLEHVESAMRRENVPFKRLSDGDSLLESREVAVMVAAFTTLWKPSAHDTDQILSWCGVVEEDLSEIHRTIGHQMPAKISKSVLAKGNFKESTATIVKSVAKQFEVWRTYLATDGIMTLVNLVSEFLASKKSGDNLSQKTFEVAKSMFWTPTKNSETFDAKMFERRVANIRAAMSGAGRGKGEELVEGNSNEPLVTLMTVHKSKGLEFDQVWIIGAEEESFPLKDGGIQEERRLMYVAMTRARKNLWLSTPGKKAQSRFIHESGIDRVPDGTFITEPKNCD